MTLSHLAVGAGAVLAATLSGCGGGDTTGAPAPAPPAPVPPPGPPACKERVPLPPVTAPGPAPDPKPGSGRYGVADDPVMKYTVIGDIHQIINYQPKCVSSFCDKNIGQKVDDDCCDPAKWVDKDGNKAPPSLLFDLAPDVLRNMDGTGDISTCYPRVAPGPFDGNAGGKQIQWIRNYIGCQDGQLYGAENCVPGGESYVTPEMWKAGHATTLCDEGKCPWTYPMNKTHAQQYFENGTATSCHCSTQSYYTQGPGCYIAFATLAQYVDMYPGVFVNISGGCEGPPLPSSVSSESSESHTEIV